MIFERLRNRLSEIYHSHGGWEWGGLLAGTIIAVRGLLVVTMGAEVLHPTFPETAIITGIPFEARSWLFLLVGAALVASIVFKHRYVRPLALIATFLCILTAATYGLISDPFKLWIQGATYMILGITCALVYTAAGDARARGW